MNKRYQKLIGNTIILAFIIAGLLWVCGKFIHISSSTFTDNAQVLFWLLKIPISPLSMPPSPIPRAQV